MPHRRDQLDGQTEGHEADRPTGPAVGRLVERVRGGAYSTFRRYRSDELESALDRFIEHLGDGDVEWHDHNLLVHVRRVG